MCNRWLPKQNLSVLCFLNFQRDSEHFKKDFDEQAFDDTSFMCLIKFVQHLLKVSNIRILKTAHQSQSKSSKLSDKCVDILNKLELQSAHSFLSRIVYQESFRIFLLVKVASLVFQYKLPNVDFNWKLLPDPITWRMWKNPTRCGWKASCFHYKRFYRMQQENWIPWQLYKAHYWSIVASDAFLMT